MSQFVNQAKILTAFVVPKHLWSTPEGPSTDTIKNPSAPAVQAEVVHAADTTLECARQVLQTLRGEGTALHVVQRQHAQTTGAGQRCLGVELRLHPDYKAVYVDKDPAHHKLWFPANLGIHGCGSTPPRSRSTTRRCAAR